VAGAPSRRHATHMRLSSPHATARLLGSPLPASHPPELDFIHLSQFASQLIGNDIQCSLRPKGWPCSPCRSPLAVLLEFWRRSFRAPCAKHVKLLLTGAVLAPGKRTITAVLGIMGLSTEPHSQTYHRVLNRAVWSPLTASRLLLRLLVAVVIPPGGFSLLLRVP